MKRLTPDGRAQAVLALLAFVVGLDSFAQSMSFPLLPRLAQDLLAGDAVHTARWVGWLEVAWAAPQMLAAPVLGSLSDRYGRRVVIVASTLGVGVELILNALAPNIGWLLAGRILCGASCGGQAAAMAAVADLTNPGGRAAAYGRLNAALWGGIVIGPAFGGLLASVSLRTPFWAAASVALAAGAFGFVLLPRKSACQQLRDPIRWMAPWREFGILGGSRAMVLLSAASLMLWLALQASDNMLVLYTTHRYGWGAAAFGWFCAAFAGVGLIVQAWLSGLIARRAGERSAALAGLGLGAAGAAAMGLAPNGVWFCLASLAAILAGCGRPALQAMMAAQTGAEDQGRLQGALAGLGAMISIAAPPLVTQLFAWSISAGHSPGWSGATLFLAAAATLTALAFVAATPPGQQPYGWRP